MFYVENNVILNDTVCQCCLKGDNTEGANLVSIYSGNVEIGKESKKIYELFNTFADDSGVFRECQEGSMICGDCLQQLINTTNFYQTCVKSHTIIRMKHELDLEVNTPIREYTVSMANNNITSDVPLIRIPTPPVVVYQEEIAEKPIVVFQENNPGDLQWNHPICFFECFKCDMKRTVFETQTTFLVHLSEIHGIPCISCQTCGAVFDNTVDSDAHRLKHYIKNDLPYNCETCTAQFPSAQALQSHSVIHSKDVYCQICLKQFDDLASLHPHLHQHVEQRVLPCIYCNLQFRSAATLNEHITENHDDRKFMCDKENCRERFVNRDMLRKHYMEVHEVIRETYVCKVCKEEFQEKSVLTDHLETHLNGNKFIPVHTTSRNGHGSNNNNKNPHNSNKNNKNKGNNNNNRIDYPGNSRNYQNNYDHGNYECYNHQSQGHSTGERNFLSERSITFNNRIHQQGGDNKKPVKRLWNKPKGNVHSRLG